MEEIDFPTLLESRVPKTKQKLFSTWVRTAAVSEEGDGREVKALV